MVVPLTVTLRIIRHRIGGVEIAERGQAGSPGSGGASPYLNTHFLRPTKGAEDEETCGDANAGVSDVERRPRIFANIEVQKISHRPAKNPIGHISKDAAGE